MKLNYREVNPGSPRKLLILHGLLGSSQNWVRVAPRLAENTHVLIPDLRNHGASPHASHSLQWMYEDILEFLNDHDIKQTFLLGHSLGGLAAMRFAFQNPERLDGLIVEDISPASRLNRMDTIFHALTGLDLSKIRTRQEADEHLSQKIPHREIRQFLLQNLKRKESGAFFWRCNLKELERFTKTNEFRLTDSDRFDGPSLFIGGMNSEQTIDGHTKILSRHFPNYVLVMIPDAGHWVHFDAMPRFAEIVTDFLKNRFRMLHRE
ncbi:MAG: alpha/beta fold hydrolase [bacterium]